MIRLHQKVNPERWYYYADTLGLAVFQDVPQKYGHASNATIPLFDADLAALISGPRANHPSIVMWDVFNEKDCVGVVAPGRRRRVRRHAGREQLRRERVAARARLLAPGGRAHGAAREPARARRAARAAATAALVV